MVLFVLIEIIVRCRWRRLAWAGGPSAPASWRSCRCRSRPRCRGWCRAAAYSWYCRPPCGRRRPRWGLLLRVWHYCFPRFYNARVAKKVCRRPALFSVRLRVEESKSRRVEKSKSRKVEESKSRRVEESKSQRVAERSKVEREIKNEELRMKN